MNVRSAQFQLGAAALVVVACLAFAGTLLVQWSARPWSGVTLEYTWPGQEGPLPIRAVESGSPADLAGLGKGQRVVSFEGVPARDTTALLKECERTVESSDRDLRISRNFCAAMSSGSFGSDTSTNGTQQRPIRVVG